MKKQSQITYDSYGFFSGSLEPESSSTYVPPSLKWKALDAGHEAHIRSANQTKQSHLMPIFRGFFAGGLPQEPSHRRLPIRGEERPKSVGGFSWRILE